MEIKHKGKNELLIEGNIKKTEHCEKIYGEIHSMVDSGIKEIRLTIPKSFAFPSFLMGDMAQITKNKDIKFTIRYGDKRLGKTLLALELDRFFTIEKLEK